VKQNRVEVNAHRDLLNLFARRRIEIPHVSACSLYVLIGLRQLAVVDLRDKGHGNVGVNRHCEQILGEAT